MSGGAIIEFPDSRNCDLLDDFIGSTIESTNKRVNGSLGWTYGGDGSVTIGAAAAGPTGNSGNAHVLSGDTSGNATWLALGNSASGGIIHPDEIDYFEFRIRFSAVGHLKASVGLGSNIASLDLGADSIGWYFSETGAVNTFARTGSVEDDINPGIGVDNLQWYRLVAYRLAGNTWGLRTLNENGTDQGLPDAHRVHLPSQPLTAGVSLLTDGTASGGQHLKIDTFAMRLKATRP